MEEIKLNDALKNCSKSCGWCTHQCPDEDKYEMLVYCIQIQKEFLAIGKLLREIIGEKSVKVVKDIGTLFELIIYDLHKKKLIVDKEY